MVTRTMERPPAIPSGTPQSRNTGVSSGAKLSAPNEAARKPARVTPIWTAEKEQVGIGGQAGHGGARLASPAEGLHLAIAERHQGHLCRGEHTTDDDEEQHQEGVRHSRVHPDIVSGAADLPTPEGSCTPQAAGSARRERLV